MQVPPPQPRKIIKTTVEKTVVFIITRLRGIILRESRDEILISFYGTICYEIRMYFFYLLENQNDKSWYIGFTSDLKRRLLEHQNGQGVGRPLEQRRAWKITPTVPSGLFCLIETRIENRLTTGTYVFFSTNL